uniref:Uncharacterized protein n=1 Tax=Anguilla anguilla TaxID=7936 RepID=A0A0E9T9V2_ANGAN
MLWRSTARPEGHGTEVWWQCSICMGKELVL